MTAQQLKWRAMGEYAIKSDRGHLISKSWSDDRRIYVLWLKRADGVFARHSQHPTADAARAEAERQ